MGRDGGTGVTIDEIKGIYGNLELLEAPVGVHLAQAKCYAYIYAMQQELAEIAVQMTYCNLDTEEIKRFREEFSFNELKIWFDGVILEYKKWADFQFAGQESCARHPLKKLEFPYEYRKGQKELAAGVYRTINRGKILFIQAPTVSARQSRRVFPAG